MTIKNQHITSCFFSVSLFQPTRKVSIYIEKLAELPRVANPEIDNTLEGKELDGGRYDALRGLKFYEEGGKRTLCLKREGAKGGEGEEEKATVELTLNRDESITIRLIPEEGEERESWEEGKIMPNGMIEGISPEFVKKFLPCEKLTYTSIRKESEKLEEIYVNPLITYQFTDLGIRGGQIQDAIREGVRKSLKEKSA